MDLLKMAVDFLFSAGLFLNALLFIPQIIKLHRTRDAGDVSKITFTGFCLMQLSAVAYGYLHHDWILVIGYALSLLSCGLTTILIFYYSAQKTRR